MRIGSLDLLVCPECSAPELHVEVYDGHDDVVEEGLITCHSCSTWYRVEQGLPDLLSVSLRRPDMYEAFIARHNLDGRVEARPIPHGIQEQLDFFAQYRDGYEAEVVDSPFYRVFDRVTFGDWMQRTLKPGDQVLELGCGSARQSLPMIARGINTVGIDLSEEMLRLARQKTDARAVPGRADFVIGSAEYPPVRPGAFDACVIFGSMHHFIDPAQVLVRAAQSLKPGGKLYLLEPHASPVRFLFDLTMRWSRLWYEEAEHEHQFTVDQIRGWLAAGQVRSEIRLSTYLPPHLWYLLPPRLGADVLRASDAVLGAVPGLRQIGGVVIAEGVKEG